MILYHVGRRAPKPHPMRPWQREFHQDRYPGRGVFLATSWRKVVAFHFGADGEKCRRVYAYDVPRWVLVGAGGLEEVDEVFEVFIPEPLWRHCRFLGLVKTLHRRELLRIWYEEQAALRRRAQVPHKLTRGEIEELVPELRREAVTRYSERGLFSRVADDLEEILPRAARRERRRARRRT